MKCQEFDHSAVRKSAFLVTLLLASLAGGCLQAIETNDDFLAPGEAVEFGGSEGDGMGSSEQGSSRDMPDVGNAADADRDGAFDDVDCDPLDPEVFPGTEGCPAARCADTPGRGVWLLEPPGAPGPFPAYCESMAGGGWQLVTTVGRGPDRSLFGPWHCTDPLADCAGSVDPSQLTCEEGSRSQLLIVSGDGADVQWAILDGFRPFEDDAMLAMVAYERPILMNNTTAYPNHYGAPLEPALRIVDSTFRPKYHSAFSVQSFMSGGFYLGSESFYEDDHVLSVGFAPYDGERVGVDFSSVDGPWDVSVGEPGALYWRCSPVSR